MDKIFSNNYECKQIANIIYTSLKERNLLNKEIVIFNIGTDAYNFDSIAPLVGTLLLEKNNLKNISVIGDLKNLNTGLNIEENHNNVNQKFNNPTIIAIDASLGENIGSILVKDSPARPGFGVKKNLTPIGDITILGIVAAQNKDIDIHKRIIRFSLVWSISDRIVNIITELDELISFEKHTFDEKVS